jgi:hypothetical protein
LLCHFLQGDLQIRRFPTALIALFAAILTLTACGDAKDPKVIVNNGPQAVSTNDNGNVVAVNAYTLRQLGGTSQILTSNSGVTLLVFELEANEDIVVEGYDYQVFTNDARKLTSGSTNSDTGQGTNGSFLDIQNRMVNDYGHTIFVKKGNKLRLRFVMFTSNTIVSGDNLTANLTNVRGFTAKAGINLAKPEQSLNGNTISA